MEERKLVITKKSLDDLFNLYISKNEPLNSELELIIQMESENLSLREYSNYFSLLDKFYGRLYPDGIYAYGHREHEQLKVSEVRNGSVETIIREVLENVLSTQNLIIVFLLMKYLPNIIKSSAEAVKNISESYKFYQEAIEIREERKNRKFLREAIKDDEQLQKLNPRQIEQIIKLLDTLYSRETKKLPRAIKTAREKVKSITLKVKKKKELH